MNNESSSKSFEKLDEEVEQLKEQLTIISKNLRKLNSAYGLTAGQVEWHLRGLVYHYERLVIFYKAVASDIGIRVVSTNADVLVMHSKEMQQLIFELYSLVNLARISLDQFLGYLRPKFDNPSSIPKSINDFLEGKSDAPIHKAYTDVDFLPYLVDIRNCIVHYRSFASENNTVAVSQNMSEEEILRNIDEHLPRPVIRTYFRKHSDNPNGVSANLLLPDAIFEKNEAGKKKGLVKVFTYEHKLNVIRFSINVVKLVGAGANCVEEMLSGEASYSWSKR